MARIGKIILWIFAVIGALISLSIAAVVFFTTSTRERVPELADNAVLHLKLNQPIQEKRGIASFFVKEEDPTLFELVQAIDNAADRPEVRGLAMQLGATKINFAHAQELGDAIRRFEAAGKKTYAYSTDLSGLGNATAEYMLASEADTLWLQPSGGVAPTGIAIEMPFAADALDELDVQARFGQRHEYKGGADVFLRDSISPAVDRSMQTLADSLLNQAVARIAENRGLDAATVRRLVDQGPFLAADAVGEGLVDSLGYEDDFTQFVRNDIPDIGPNASVAHVNALAVQDNGNAQAHVAVIYGVGPITPDEAKRSAFSDEGFGPSDVSRALKNALKDDAIDGVLFRVSSPGGAYGPSDAVWNDVKRLVDAGKPVVVSMGDIAASGGYFVSAAADRIVASPGTLTGSIGVYSGKFVTRGLWNKLGIEWSSVKAGRNAGMWSMIDDFSPSETARFNAFLDFVYEDFTAKVAMGRNLENEAAVDRAARGRIWTGEDAMEVGLVDRLGGVREALEELRILMEVEEGAPLRFTVLPKPKSPWEEALKFLEAGDLGGFVGVAVADALEERVAERLDLRVEELDRVTAQKGVLVAPPFRIR